MNATKKSKRCSKLGTTGSVGWSPENYARDEILSVLPNGICTNLWVFEIQTDHLILLRKTDLVQINKKRTCRLVDFVVRAESKRKTNKRLINTRTLLKEHVGDGKTNWAWNGRQKIWTSIGKVEVGGRIEAIQTIAFLRSTRILRRVLESRGELLSLRLQRETTSWRWCKNSQRVI